MKAIIYAAGKPLFTGPIEIDDNTGDKFSMATDTGECVMEYQFIRRYTTQTIKGEIKIDYEFEIHDGEEIRIYDLAHTIPTPYEEEESA